MRPANPSSATLTADALEMIQLDANGMIANTDAVLDALVLRHSVSSKRAWTAVACAARRLRNARFAEEGTADYTLRIRLTDAQHRRAVIEANRETGGNLSALFRLRTLG